MPEIESSDHRKRFRLLGRRELLVVFCAVLALLIVASWRGTIREEVALARLSGMPGVIISDSLIDHDVASLSHPGLLGWTPAGSLSSYRPDCLSWLFRVRMISRPKSVSVNAAAPPEAFNELGRLRNVYDLDVSNSSVTDDLLAHVVPDRFQGQLRLKNTAVTDEGLRRIVGRRVTHLDLTGTRVTDEGLKSIATFRKLETLTLTSTPITGVTLSELKRLPDLAVLILSKTWVTDQNLAGLSGHPGIGCINLSSTRVGDEALAVLATMPNCRMAVLSDTQVTGAGLIHLARCGNWAWLEFTRCPLETTAVIATDLESNSLRLNETPLDDRIIPWLLSRRRLRGVQLDGAAITNRGLAALAKPHRDIGVSLCNTTIDDAGVAAYYLGEGWIVPGSGDAEHRSLLIDEIAAAHAAAPDRQKLTASSLEGTCVSPEVLAVLDP